MTDEYGFITEESDPVVWEVLRRSWLGEHKPGYVMRGQQCYSVFVANGIPKFKLQVDKDMYNDVSV